MRQAQKLSDGEHQQRYTEAIHEAQQSGEDAFQNWFNRSQNVEQSIVRGYWDFSQHILTPTVCAHLTTPESKTVLEIGYGGGRILNAACSFFQQAIGIDVHDHQQAVTTFLESQGRSNFTLHRTGGRTIDVASGSIDLVYSFIVLQHLPTIEVLINYVEESYRCLRAGGIAQLYFGKYTKLHPLRRIQYMFRGYHEITNAPVNYTSLVATIWKMKAICRTVGFRVIDSGTSYKTVPDGYPKVLGGQSYVTLLK